MDKQAQAWRRWSTLLWAVLIPIGVMYVAISPESFWIDEFWSAHFATLPSLAALLDLLLVPSGSQTPLHFGYITLWGQVFPMGEQSLRLSNLPLFVLGQASLWWALRPYGRPFAHSLMVLGALHPMVWQYANELRPYIMMYAGAQMIFAYLLHLHSLKPQDKISPWAHAIFFTGSVLLFGASLLGVFWVAVACVYVAFLLHHRLGWARLKERPAIWMWSAFAAVNGLLTVYYVSSLLQGAGASRITSTTLATLAFDAYELLGLAGLGPSRLELRDSGIAALLPYGLLLAAAALVISLPLCLGVFEAVRRFDRRQCVVIAVLALLPMAIVVLSGYVMHWRVLGRHLIAELPLLNALLALGGIRLWTAARSQRSLLKPAAAALLVVVFLASSLSLRFADRHKKDDYRSAVALATAELAKGSRVWWAAGALGAHHYQLAGTFNAEGELTSVSKPYDCVDQAGAQAVSEAPADCLERLKPPQVIIVSKPETFDLTGAVAAYLNAKGFVPTQKLPAFTVWRAADSAAVKAP